MQEVLDSAQAAGMGADALDQAAGTGINPRLGRRRARHRGKQPRRDLFVRCRIGCDKGAWATGVLGVRSHLRLRSTAPLDAVGNLNSAAVWFLTKCPLSEQSLSLRC